MTGLRAPLIVALAIVALAGCTAPAEAQCWVWSVEGVNFGTYDVFSGAPLDSMGRLTVLCIPAAWIQVSLNRGGAPSFDPRRMRSGPNTLDYNLYLDAGRNVIWGDGSGGTQMYQGNDWWHSLPIYGRIPASQDVATGSYTNRIVATINF